MRYYIIIALLCTLPLSAEPIVSIRSIAPDPASQRISVHFSVTNPDRYRIASLDEEQVHLFEDGFRVNYLRVEPDKVANQPLFSVILFDAACSPADRKLQLKKGVGASLLKHVSGNDKTALFSHSSEARIIAGFQTSKKEKVRALRDIEPVEKSPALLPALYEALALLKDVQSPHKRVIVLSDGVGAGGDISADDIIRAAKEQGIALYFIVRSKGGQKAASRIATLTGGDLYCLNDLRTDESFRKIVSPGQAGYIATYISMLGFDGNKHTVELRLQAGEIRDRGRGEFVAEKQQLDIARLMKSGNPLGTIMLVIMSAMILMLLFFVLRMIIFKRGGWASAGHRPVREQGPVPFQEQGYAIAPAVVSLPGSSREEPSRPQSDDLMHMPEEQKYSTAWLMVKHEKGNRKIELLHDLSIGSGAGNNLILHDEAVSETHARIKKINEGFYLFDLVSGSGVFLNGKKMLRPKPLYDWDEIALGKSRLIFRGAHLNGN